MSLDKTGAGLGIDRQEKQCREKCAELGFEVADVFIDNDISATTGKRRPAFEALLASAPENVVVWHLDRLLRQNKDLERVIDLEVDVHPVTAAKLDLSTPTGRMNARLGTVVSTYEGEHKAERQRASARQRAEQGKAWWSSRPFGFELDGTHRTDEAGALAQVYADLLTGASLPGLARQLNDEGHTTCRGSQWTATTLRPVLLNARNAAVRVYDGEEMGPAAWEPIIPEDRWRAAVRLLTNPTRRTGGGGAEPRNLLTGLASCGKCGGGVKVGWRGGRAGEPGAYAVYVCRTSSCVSVRVIEADAAVTTRLAVELDSPHAREEWQASRKRGGEVSQALLVEEATLRSRLDAVAEDYADGVMDRGQFRAATERLRGRLAEVERQISEAGQVADLAETVSHGSEALMSFLALDPNTPDPESAPMDVDELRTLIAAVFERVEFMPRGRGVRMLHPDHFRFTSRHPAVATARE